MPRPAKPTTFNVVVGQTAPIDVYLRDDEETPEGNLAGTVTLLLADDDGNPINFTGNVSIQDAATWKVRVSPDAGDFATPGNYRGRFKVTDDNSKDGYFPDGPWDIWRVRSVY